MVFLFCVCHYIEIEKAILINNQYIEVKQITSHLSLPDWLYNQLIQGKYSPSYIQKDSSFHSLLNELTHNNIKNNSSVDISSGGYSNIHNELTNFSVINNKNNYRLSD